MKANRHVEPRTDYQPPEVIVADLMRAVFVSFYGPDAQASWWRDQKAIKRDFVLWPAAWFKDKGLAVPALEYKRLLLDLITEIKVHGRQEKFDWFPSYLKKCVREHFHHQGERLIEQFKGVNARVTTVVDGLPKPVANPVWALADVHDFLVKGKRRAKVKAPVPLQRELL